MEKIDLSSNSKKIQDLYNKVMRGDGAATYAVFSVDKNGVLDASASGDGDLSDFVEEFSDGQVQFGLARVTVPGSDVFKNLLLGWCPDNAPIKLRMSFASNFADVLRVLSGYHVQITARDQDDLDVNDFVARVVAAAGANYSAQMKSSAKPVSKPAPKQAAAKPAVKPAPKPVVPKPSFVPSSTGKPVVPVTPKPTVPKPAFSTPAKSTGAEDDGWGGEKELEERDFERQPLESVPSAYKPTKVDIAALRKQKSDTISSTPKPVLAKADAPLEEKKDAEEEPHSLQDRMKAYQANDGRLTSLPKPKVNHDVSSRYAPAAASAPGFGAKPSFGTSLDKRDKLVGGISRNFGAENGKTPAQLWAEKRGKYQDVPKEELEAKTEALSIEPEEKKEEASEEVADEPEQEEEPEQEPEQEEESEEAEEEEEEEEEVKPAPVVIKPASFAPPPKRNLPPAPPTEKEPSPSPSPVPSLPGRSIPPLPSREEAAPPLPTREETAPSLPSREEPAPTLPSREEPAKAEKTGITAVAQYDYEKDEDNEIGFEEGDLIVDIEFVDEEWWSGTHSKTGELGLFPGSYVQVEEAGEKAEDTADDAPAEEPEKSTGRKAVAEYDYEKDEDNEISFAEGDFIVEIDFVDDSWWSGKHAKTGNVGLFPANYVSLQ